MGKSAPQAPQPFNPVAAAQAQGAADISTAIASAWLNNANQKTPYGTTTYTQTGTKEVDNWLNDQNNVLRNKPVTVPIFTSEFKPDKLTVDGKEVSTIDQQQLAEYNLSKLGADQSRRLGTVLGNPFNPANLSPGVNTAPAAPNLTAAEGLRPGLFSAYDVYDPVNSYARNNQQTTFGDAGAIQRSVGANDFGAQRTAVEDAMYARINPQIDRDRASLQTRLANQGVVQGSTAYNQATDELNRQINDQRTQVTLAGGQEQSRLFGMDLSKGQFANSAEQQAYDQAYGRGGFANQATEANNNSALQAAQFYNQTAQQRTDQSAAARQFYNQAMQQNVQNNMLDADQRNQVASQNYALDNEQARLQQELRQQDLQEEFALRNQPIAEIAALLGGGAPTVPQFQPFQGSQIPSTPVGSYMAQASAMENQQYNTQMQQYNAGLGGMYGLGATALGGMFRLSDRRTKKDITRVGTLDNGIPIYLFTYKTGGAPQIGLMADDVEKVIPEAVQTIGPHGFKSVRYDLAVRA